ncbi:MAG: YbaB/EbfC family nucleoid-associated protein [Rhizobiales bacterium]|nr:YbaB/EbfC family nucleoid-associated protein [Hyphomicrobiales bacterium]
MTDFLGMMKQAKQLQEKMQAMQEGLAEIEVEGSSGGGLLSVTLSGKGEMVRVHIDPSMVKPDDAQILEDLLVAAHNDAKSKLEATLAEKMSELTGGLPLPPGFNLGG